MTELRVVEVVDDALPAIEFDYELIADPVQRDWAESAAGFITFGLGQAVVKVLEAGNLLIEAKQRLAHGEYLPWVEQACGLKESYARKLVQAAQWVNREHAPGLDSITDATTLFLLSADATPEDVRQWALERCAAGDPPTRKEVQERKRSRSEAGRQRTVVQEALSALKLSDEARELAAKAQHISTRQLMDELDVEELPKGKEHKTAQFTFCKNGTGWWKLPIEQPIEVPIADAEPMLKPEPEQSREQTELLASESEWETVFIAEAAQRMGFEKSRSLSCALSPSFIAKRGLPTRNGWEAARSDKRGKCLIRKTI
tara:strand:- start:1811 stop:2755 length:945 start_codon:yes stop_codon:yes gene_type:complete